MKKSNKTKKESTSKKPEKSSSFTKKIVIEIVVFLLLLTFGTLLLNKSLKFENKEIIEYNEKSNLDYKVYLFENEFYEEPYLGKDMLYVASLINKIHIDFNYKFEIAGLETLDFDYKIVGKLSITNREATRSYYEKSYTLLDSKTLSMKDKSEQEIKESIDVNYSYYNSVANNFKNTYGVDTESNLTVFMVIDKKNNQESNFSLNSNSIMSVIIPLSEKAINIELDYNDINKSSTVVKDKKIAISNIILLGVSTLLIIASIVMVVRIVRKLSTLFKKKSAYDKYINKLLKEYDRLIAEASTMMSLDEKEIIKLNKFTELLDVHDNLQLPIMYYSVKEHEKSHFYISHDKTIYILTIKSVDNDNYTIEK